MNQSWPGLAGQAESKLRWDLGLINLFDLPGHLSFICHFRRYSVQRCHRFITLSTFYVQPTYSITRLEATRFQSTFVHLLVALGILTTALFAFVIAFGWGTISGSRRIDTTENLSLVTEHRCFQERFLSHCSLDIVIKCDDRFRHSAVIESVPKTRCNQGIVHRWEESVFF